MTGDFEQTTDPIALFSEWLGDAEASEPNDPNAMALATVDADGLPDVRMVLLKGYDADGFVFFTNYESAKGTELLANPKAALCFHWKSLRRSVRVRGKVSQVSADEADAYFKSRVARQPDRRMGEQAVAAAGIALRAGEGGRRPTPRNSASARSRGRTTGRASGSRRNRSSSGRTGRSGSMTGSGSRGDGRRLGRRRGSILKSRAGNRQRVDVGAVRRVRFRLLPRPPRFPG